MNSTDPSNPITHPAQKEARDGQPPSGPRFPVSSHPRESPCGGGRPAPGLGPADPTRGLLACPALPASRPQAPLVPLCHAAGSKQELRIRQDTSEGLLGGHWAARLDWAEMALHLVCG